MQFDAQTVLNEMKRQRDELLGLLSRQMDTVATQTGIIAHLQAENAALKAAAAPTPPEETKS